LKDPRNVPVAIPTTLPSPQIQAVSRGERYGVHLAQGGRLFRAEVTGSMAGDNDALSVGYDGGRLHSLSFSPQRGGVDYEPVLGLSMGDRERAVFRVSGLTIGAGGRVDVAASGDQRGVAISASQAITYNLTVETADGMSGKSGAFTYGPFTLPAGGTHRQVLASWPESGTLSSEEDADGDGTPERIGTVAGLDCASADENQNGIPDKCEAQSGGASNGGCGCEIGPVSAHPPVGLLFLMALAALLCRLSATVRRR
jgi:hypothetical protein